MSHRLTLDLPDEVYAPLAQQAQATGQTVEAIAQACLTESVQELKPGGRLRRWAGTVDSGLADVATRHHDYLGEALVEKRQGRPDA